MKTFSYYSIKAGPYFSEPLYRPGWPCRRLAVLNPYSPVPAPEPSRPPWRL